ncbi:MAG: tetratricopeptide repeat protein, partial [Proteobacteria bacterium]|nr:tetratricopeptide repeat protein [Pseudomonadota bacterium]
MKRLALTMAIAVSFSCTGTAFGQGRPSDAEGESYGLGMTGRPPGRSEDSVQAGPINVGGVQMTAAEQSAFSLVNSGKYIRARKEAEDLLKENPDSFIGKYVLARVFHFGEGNLLRAMQLYREALTRFEAEYCQGSEIPATSTLQNWHQLVLTDIARLYGELDHREAQLAAYDRVDALYKTPRSIRSTWALIKLGRFEEADEIIQATIKGEDSFSRDEGYNNAIALADAMYSHTRAYQAGLEAINYTGTRSCVILSNHARSERQFLEFDSALENIMKASHANNDCPVPPLLSAVPIYLTMGGYQQAISTMLKVRRMPIEKRMVVQLEMQLRTALANLFHIMGFSDKAHSLMRTVLDAPDRLGFDSLHQDQVRLANLITFHAIMSDYLRQIDDEIAFHKAYSPRWFFSKAQREAMFERYKLRESLLRARWSNDQQAYRLVLDPKNLMALLVPFYVM